MPDHRVCKVCGGRVGPVEGQGVFSYCESCGIVYALKGKVPEQESVRSPTREIGPSEQAVTRGTVQAHGSRWTCPDCGAELKMDDDVDLQFAKREHIREYHPNRTTD